MPMQPGETRRVTQSFPVYDVVFYYAERGKTMLGNDKNGCLRRKVDGNVIKLRKSNNFGDSAQ